MSASRIRAVLALAGKDLRLLSRNRATLFFALGWPVLMALFFGYVFGGGGEKGRIPVVVVDEDRTGESARLVAPGSPPPRGSRSRRLPARRPRVSSGRASAPPR